MVSQLIFLNLLSVLSAYMLDRLFSDPDFSYHPVRLIGGLVSSLERRLYDKSDKVYAGKLLLVQTVLVSALSSLAILYIAYIINPLLFYAVNTVIIFFCISIRSMCEHALAVYYPLSDGRVDSARHALSMIVSRDVESMNESGIVSSAVESVSENFTDGVLSPVLYSALLGGFGGILFKSVSTLDSMVGYKNERYTEFGRASAIADDILNYIPARLSLLVISVGSYISGLSSSRTFFKALQYRKAHASPNSAHSMAAFAGALGIRLGGSVSYFGNIKEKPYIGDGRSELFAGDIVDAVNLFVKSSRVSLLLFVVAPLLLVMI